MNLVSDVEVVGEIYSLIQNAERYLILVSPYIDTWERLENEVRRAVRRGVSVQLYVRYETTGKQDPAHHLKKAQGLKNLGVHVSAIRRLHSKVYVSENRIVMTSMNLLKSSAIDSLEMGICWGHSEQPEMTEKVRNYVQGLERYVEPKVFIEARAKASANSSSKRGASRRRKEPVDALSAALGMATHWAQNLSESSTSTSKKAKGTSSKKATYKTRSSARTRASKPTSSGSKWKQRLRDDEGCCLRCREIIDYDPARPYCFDCFSVWQRYGDDEYVEEVCHACGDASDTSMRRPLCRPCFRQYG